MDVLAELERIRKQALRPEPAATAPPPAPLSRPAAPPPAPAASAVPVAGNGKGEIHRSLELTLKRADFRRARRVTFSFRVEDGQNQVVDGIRDFPVELQDVAALEKILLRLNIAVHAKE